MAKLPFSSVILRRYKNRIKCTNCSRVSWLSAMRVFSNSHRLSSQRANQTRARVVEQVQIGRERTRVAESTRMSLRVHESFQSFRPNESKNLNSCQLSSSFGLGLRHKMELCSCFTSKRCNCGLIGGL